MTVAFTPTVKVRVDWKSKSSAPATSFAIDAARNGQFAHLRSRLLAGTTVEKLAFSGDGVAVESLDPRLIWDSVSPKEASPKEVSYA